VPDPAPALPRLYAILDVQLTASRGLAPQAVVDDWLGAGVRLIQLRAKSMSLGPFLELASTLAQACRAAGAHFIVNDRADVARLVRASGVHVGQDDLTPAEVRRIAPDARLIGLSTHSDAQIEAGLATPASYLAMGPVFGTTTKARPDPVVGLAGITRTAARLGGTGRPLVGIGGIDVETAPAVVAAGAASVAVISDLIAGNDIAARARAFLRALE
jgi:thiamine-phosphate pyrophosphorylase